MASAEWLRTFVAVYRSGSVSGGALHRGLTQPAASQHVAALERGIGQALFVRKANGVEPTQHGRELYATVAESLDGIEPILRGLDVGMLRPSEPPLRVGSSPELFAAEVLPKLVRTRQSSTATFGTDTELFRLLERGELDLVVTSSTPARRSITAVPIGTKRFVLVAAPSIAPAVPLTSLPELALWLADRPWASYSIELPLTRRFWLSVLGRPFSARPHLVAPDLRAVLRAVELGLGVSMLPTFVCRDALGEGRVCEVFPIADLAPEEPWFACLRQADLARPNVAELLAALQTSGERAGGSTRPPTCAAQEPGASSCAGGSRKS